MIADVDEKPKRKRGRPKGSKNKKTRRGRPRKNPNSKIKNEIVRFAKKTHHDLEWLWKIKDLSKKFKKTWKELIDENIEIFKYNCNVDLINTLMEWKDEPETPVFFKKIYERRDLWKGNTVEDFIVSCGFIEMPMITKPYKPTIKLFDDKYLFRIKVGNDDDYCYFYILTNDIKKIRKKMNLRKEWKKFLVDKSNNP